VPSHYTTVEGCGSLGHRVPALVGLGLIARLVAIINLGGAHDPNENGDNSDVESC